MGGSRITTKGINNQAGNTHQIRHCRHIRLEDVKAVCNGVGYWPCGKKEKYKAHFLGKDILVPCKTAEAENAKHGFRLCERERQTSWFAANELWIRSDYELKNFALPRFFTYISFQGCR